MSSHLRLNALVIVCASTFISGSLFHGVIAEDRIDGPVNVKSDAAEHPAQRLTTPAVPANPTKTNDAAGRAADPKALERRAGELSHEDPNARSMVLGMDLQESPDGRPVVVGVGVATPAYDAGVKKGDEIVVFQNFTGRSYRSWVDGVRRLTSDAPGNSPILIVVNRDGNRVPITIRTPVTPARPLATRVPGVRATPSGQAGQTVVNQQAQAVPTGVPVGGGGDVLIDNQLGNFFGTEAAGTNERAIAHIVRIHEHRPPQSPAPPSESTGANTTLGQNSSVGAGTANATGAPARIGLAGFRDDPSGMVVMVDVGSLQPGNYSVAIGDPSVISAGLGTTVDPAQNSNVQAPAGANPATAPTNAGDRPSRRVDSPADTPAGAVPSDTPTSTPLKRAGQPQSSARPSSLIPRTVLAQVNTTDQNANSGTAAPATGSSAGSTAVPATGQVNPSTVPATGKLNPSSPTTSSPQQNAAASTGPSANGAAGASAGTLGDIGTLTVDQSGTGRMQKTVESMRVRNVVGQAIILYSQGNLGQATLPANLNGSAGAASKQGVVDVPNAAQGNSATNPARTTGSSAIAQQAAPNSRIAVAAGIIRLVPSHPTTNGAAGPGTASSTNTETATPSTATPKGGQELIR